MPLNLGRESQRAWSTTTDLYSRYLLCCEALAATNGANVIPIFEQLFRRYGLPAAIRSDNGPPFASVGPGGFTALSAWWLRLGIRHDRIEPGRPDENGSHERMHLTLKLEIGRPQANRAAQQRVLDEFRRTYNEERPHEAIGQETPSSLYYPSPRPLPAVLPPLTYPPTYQVYCTDEKGRFRNRGSRQNVPVGCALARQPVGLEEKEDGIWVVHFGHVVLGTLEAGRPGRLKRPTNSRRRRKRLIRR